MVSPNKLKQINFRVTQEEYDDLVNAFGEGAVSENVRAAVKDRIRGLNSYAADISLMPANVIDGLRSHTFSEQFNSADPIFLTVPGLHEWGHSSLNMIQIGDRILRKQKTLILTQKISARRYETLMREFMFSLFDHINISLEEITPNLRIIQIAPENRYVNTDRFSILSDDTYIEQITVPFGLMDCAYVYNRDDVGAQIFSAAVTLTLTMLETLEEFEAVPHYFNLFKSRTD